LDSDQQISEWSVRTDDDRKLLSITGERVEPGHVRLLIQKAGFEVFDEISARAIEAPSSFQQAPPAGETYFPLMLVFLYLTGFAALSQFRAGRWDSMAAMNAFMGGFFVVFSFFKLLNIRWIRGDCWRCWRRDKRPKQLLDTSPYSREGRFA
jgi:hypothetical protein